MNVVATNIEVRIKPRQLTNDSFVDFFIVEDKREFTAAIRDGNGDLWDCYIVELITCFEDVLMYYLPPLRFDAVMKEWYETNRAILRAAKYCKLQSDWVRYEKALDQHRANLLPLLRRLRRMIQCSNIRFYARANKDKGIDLKARGGHGHPERKKVLAGARSLIRRGSRGRGCGGVG